MKNFLLFLLFFIVVDCSAQYTLRLTVSDVATKKQDDIYVAGSFNNWSPRDEKFKLKVFGTTRRGVVLSNLPPGNVEFKFTRGTWDKVETTAKGEDIANRKISIHADTAIDFKIPGWKDDYPDKPKPYTATAQVSIVDTAFNIPQLNRKRRIWAYMPKGYSTSKKAYPVIYMHDGQNLFNEQTAPFGEWGVDECLDTLMRKLNKECIVIGIDNGGEKRMNEYNPYDDAKFGKGEGNQYVDFIVTTLKPFIDKKFRTLKDRPNTYIAGSSMGGLISMHAVTKYPDVFGGAGVFSPSFWIAPQLYPDIEKANWSAYMPKFFFYAGGKEGETTISDMDKVIGIIEKKGHYSYRRIVNPIAKHNEQAWRFEFPGFYQFITQ